MPDARTHDIITYATAAALAPIAQATQVALLDIAPPAAWANTAWLVVAHILSGVMFSPDLDLDSAIDDRWGVLFWIWRPYMWAIPHRSAWSHSLVFAPLLRLVQHSGNPYGVRPEADDRRRSSETAWRCG